MYVRTTYHSASIFEFSYALLKILQGFFEDGVYDFEVLVYHTEKPFVETWRLKNSEKVPNYILVVVSYFF